MTMFHKAAEALLRNEEVLELILWHARNNPRLGEDSPVGRELSNRVRYAKELLVPFWEKRSAELRRKHAERMGALDL